MRNLKRLSLEIKILEQIYGYDSIFYPEDGSWVKITNFRLPSGKYNLSYCTVLIMIPSHFDDVEVTECYIDKRLRLRQRWGWIRLPHTSNTKFAEEGYQWICFDPNPGKPTNRGLLDFINTLKTYLSDPIKYQKL